MCFQRGPLAVPLQSWPGKPSPLPPPGPLPCWELQLQGAVSQEQDTFKGRGTQRLSHATSICVMIAKREGQKFFRHVKDSPPKSRQAGLFLSFLYPLSCFGQILPVLFQLGLRVKPGKISPLQLLDASLLHSRPQPQWLSCHLPCVCMFL